MRQGIKDTLIEVIGDCIGLAIQCAIISASVVCAVKVLIWMFK